MAWQMSPKFSQGRHLKIIFLQPKDSKKRYHEDFRKKLCKVKNAHVSYLPKLVEPKLLLLLKIVCENGCVLKHVYVCTCVFSFSQEKVEKISDVTFSFLSIIAASENFEV